MSDEIETLATEWQKQAPPHEEIRRTLGRAMVVQRRRRLIVLGVFLVAWLFLVTLVLLGYEGMNAMTQGFRIACAAFMPLWLLPLLRLSWHGQPLGAPVGELLESELVAQRTLARVLGFPLPQVAFSAYAAFAVHVAVAHGVFISGRWMFSVVAAVLWLTFAVVGWIITWRWLRRTLATIRVLALSVGRDPDEVVSPRVSTITGIAGVASLLVIVIAGMWPLTYIGPSREWEAQLAARDRGRHPAAEILAQRIERMDERFAADASAPSTLGGASRRDAVVRLRGVLEKPGMLYLKAVRKARAAATGPSLDVEEERIDWLDAAEAALVAERMGPRELTALLRDEAPSSPCLQLPAAIRLQRLASEAARPEAVASDLDCLLATLEDPTSPMLWRDGAGDP